MANMNESPLWRITVNQVEQDEFIGGGENGSFNQSYNQLADRTQWLKQNLETVIAKLNEIQPVITENTQSPQP